MRVVFLTGIWPPDVGGPATHGPDFARFLRDRGHAVEVVTMSDAEPTDRPVPLVTVDRSSPFPIRYSRVALAGAKLARHADVVYATGTYAAAAAASVLSHKRLVVKLVSDPAYERAVRSGRFGGTLEDFQRAAGVELATLKRMRTTVLRRAARIVVPSGYLASYAISWGLPADRVEVLFNPAPAVDSVVPESLDEGSFVFVGRLTKQKALSIALQAIELVPEAKLVVVGDGPQRDQLEREASERGIASRVRFLGARSRDEALGYLAGAGAALLTSDWENFPHAAVEALAVGTPVLATAVGGVPEVVRDGENGLLVEPGDVQGVAAAMRKLLDVGARDLLAASARLSVASLSQDVLYGRLEQILLAAAQDPHAPR